MPLLRRLTMLAGAAEAARRYARNNPEKVNRLADSTGRFIDRRTKGKYHGKIDHAVRRVRASVADTAYKRRGH